MNIIDVNFPVADNLKRLLREKGLKQNALAKDVGLSIQQMCDILNGRRVIKPCEIMKLAEALEADPGELFGTCMKKLKVGGGTFKEIQILRDEGELIASITGKDAIVADGYEVVCVPIGF